MEPSRDITSSPETTKLQQSITCLPVTFLHTQELKMDLTSAPESSTAVLVPTQDFTQLSQSMKITHQKNTVPAQDYFLLSQPAKSETQKIVLTCSVKREKCPSPIFRVGPQSEVLTSAVKSERLTPLSSPVNPNSVKSEDTSCSATSSPALTTELENFQDLTEWCHRAPKTPNMSFLTGTDELNTPPVLEFGEFMFTSPTTIDNTNDDCFGLLNVPGQNGSPELYNVGADIQSNKFIDLECQIFGNDSTDNFNNIKSETYQYANVFNGGGEDKESLKTKNVTYMNNYNLNNVFTKCTDTVYSEFNQQTSVSYDPKPNTNVQISSTGLSQETSEDILSFAQSSSFLELQPEAAMNLQELVNFPLETVVLQPATEKKPLTRLDFSNICFDSKQIISTPEVINAALSLENGFNLVNFITEGNVVAEEVSTSSITSPEEDSKSHCPSPTNDLDPNYTPSEASDEDEEYEPPWKKQKTPSKPVATKQKKHKTKSPVHRLDLDYEVSNASTVESVKIVRRGRPPKRNVSISSESNGDPDVSRYRELRDKNNEASRRSRQNRKKKEQEMEHEANDLDMRNRKLKVRVQELEKLVTTMRTNLMQMLLRK